MQANGLSIPHHAGQHAAKAPHVQGVVVLLVVNQELWTLEVPRGHSDVVLLSWVVELSQTPVNQTQLGRARKVFNYFPKGRSIVYNCVPFTHLQLNKNSGNKKQHGNTENDQVNTEAVKEIHL